MTYFKRYIALFFLFCSCNTNAQKKQESLFNYDLSNPKIILLTKKIDEISGLSFSQKDTSLFAIDDDNGDLYNILPSSNPEIKQWKFGKNADYEDLAIVDSTFYILESSGKLLSFPKKFPITDVKEYSLNLKGLNEFETLYYEPSMNRLVLVCKECSVDDGSKVSAYSFDLQSESFSEAPVLTLKRKDIEKFTGKKTGRLKLSAGTIDPTTGNLFLVSSINKLLIITDRQFGVKEVIPLKRSMFKQPEGIAFAPDGTMFISNEAGKRSKANILIFKK